MTPTEQDKEELLSTKKIVDELKTAALLGTDVTYEVLADYIRHKAQSLINQQVVQARDKIIQIIRSTDYTPKSLDESYDRALVELYKKQLIDLIKEYKGEQIK